MLGHYEIEEASTSKLFGSDLIARSDQASPISMIKTGQGCDNDRVDVCWNLEGHVNDDDDYVDDELIPRVK